MGKLSIDDRSQLEQDNVAPNLSLGSNVERQPSSTLNRDIGSGAVVDQPALVRQLRQHFPPQPLHTQHKKSRHIPCRLRCRDSFAGTPAGKASDQARPSSFSTFCTAGRAATRAWKAARLGRVARSMPMYFIQLRVVNR